VSLRRAAIVIGMLAWLAAAFGVMPGRETTRDVSDCYITGIFDGPNPQNPCAREYVTTTRPSVDFSVVIAMVVIALGAIGVIIVPRPRVAGGWLIVSAFAGFLAFVLTRGWAVHPSETESLWPRYATWSAAVAAATGLFAVLIWLIMNDGVRPTLPVARVIRNG
jgi:hypothetical protein